MFRQLHRICVGFCWLAVIVVAGALYCHRSLFYPLVDLVDALWVHEGREQQKSGELSGTVTRVLSGDMFILRDDRGRPHTMKKGLTVRGRTANSCGCIWPICDFAI